MIIHKGKLRVINWEIYKNIPLIWWMLVNWAELDRINGGMEHIKEISIIYVQYWQ